MPAVCAIDFGTSNSAIALPRPGQPVQLVDLEDGRRTMPTAVFYAVEGLSAHEEPHLSFGRAAIAAYVEGHEGRLMRSMKSILGSTLADQSTEVGEGRTVRYLDVVTAYLRHLKALAERDAGSPLHRTVLGRPVFFVDGDPERDRAAQAALERSARSAGFAEISFQYEPIAAALDFETTVDHEHLVLVADIGGGTSDFSLVRVGPQRRRQVDRRSDILANHGVHVAGTDFDRRIELAHMLPPCGYRGVGPGGREVPSKVYHDLATWHLINTVSTPQRIAELQHMKSFYADLRQHARLMQVLRQRLGHALIGEAESAKIAVAEGGSTRIDLSMIESGLYAEVQEADAIAAIQNDVSHIVAAAVETITLAGIAADQVDALYFTGGSTGLRPLAQRIATRFPKASVVRGDRFSSVAQGLGIHAQRVFAG